MRQLRDNWEKACPWPGAKCAGLSLIAAACTWLPAGALGGWGHYAKTPSREAITVAAPSSIDFVCWTAAPEADEEFVSRVTPVGVGPRVYAIARVYEDFMHVSNRVIALDVTTGARQWSTDIAADVLDSWSSPAVYPLNSTIIVCSDVTVHGIDTYTGAIDWERDLANPVVNASPVVTSNLSTGGVPSNRVLITDYNPFGTAYIYAINVDPHVHPQNPFVPGEIVWYKPIAGGAGNSPAYDAGVVYCASTTGKIYAFDAASGATVWTRQTPAGEFYGAVTIAGDSVYAATYNFNGGSNNSRLYKLSASNGTIVWMFPCERTASTPIVEDGRIYLSGGINGFGSANRVQAFDDLGASASLAWDTYAGSGGALNVGGWTHQPAYHAGRLFVGVPPATGGFDAYVEMKAISTALTPSTPGFVIQSKSNIGGSPSIFGTRMFTIGPPGVVAICAYETETVEVIGPPGG